MQRSLKNSNAQFARAVKKLPLGVSSNFRYWGDDLTIYIKRAKGARIWDLDENEYIDYRLAYGPVILGYADERVDAAVREGMEVGGVLARRTQRQHTGAERRGKNVKKGQLGPKTKTPPPKPPPKRLQNPSKTPRKHRCK